MKLKLFILIIMLALTNTYAASNKSKKPPVKPNNNKIISHDSEVKNLKEPEQDPQDSVNKYGIEILSKQAFLMDYDTGCVLLEKNSDKPMHPSSMTKIMTAYLIMDQIKKGSVHENTLLIAGRNVWNTEGTKMHIEVGQQASIIDLLKGLIIDSGNDAAIVLAEGVFGTEANCAKMMTEKAHEMGALNTNFVNASGLPNDNHITTAKEIALIAKRAISDFPEYYYLYSESHFTFNKITQMSKNPLLHKRMNGIIFDGIKTGNSNIAGCGMVASGKYKGRRLILVINGLSSKQARADESFNLLNWGFNNFSNYYFFKPQQLVAEIPVCYGSTNKLPVTVEKGAVFSMERAKVSEVKAKIIYSMPLSAPINKGDVVGKIMVSHPTWANDLEFPLVAAVSINRGNFFNRLADSLYHVFFGVKNS